jgi:hypothetical protein
MDGAYKIKVKQGATIVLVTLVFPRKATTASIINVVLSEEGPSITGNCSNRIKNTGKK